MRFVLPRLPCVSEETAVPRRFVDLSIYLENDVMSDPPAFAPKIEYFTHENTGTDAWSWDAPFVHTALDARGGDLR
jgi:hypothetical protein